MEPPPDDEPPIHRAVREMAAKDAYYQRVYEALRAGAKKAGSAREFVEPGEHQPPERTEPGPEPTLTAAEWLARHGKRP